MIPFLLIYFTIYGAIHSYFFWKVSAAFPGLGGYRIPLGGFLVWMTLSPLLVHVLDRRGYVRSASVLGRSAYVWMAVVFWFCVLGLSADAWNLVVGAIAAAAPAASAALVPCQAGLAVIAGIITVASCLGLAQAGNIRLRRFTVEVPHWPAGTQPITLAQISDLHLGVHTGGRRLAKAIRLIEQARPDVLVSTGDLVDSPLRNVESLAGLLRSVKPPLGKFAVLGNHEFYCGVPNSLAFLELGEFRVLRSQGVTLAQRLRIVGVDDPAGIHVGQETYTDEDAVLPPGRDALATVLLKHQPGVSGASLGRFDLQLSGHTHGGQVFPFHLIIALIYRFYHGWHELGEGASLYVSRGTGTWGPPLTSRTVP